MQRLALTLCGSLLLPNLQLTFTTAAANASVLLGEDCHGQLCHPVEEYCSAFSETCEQCAPICDPESHNFDAARCGKECAAYNKYEPLKAEIHSIQTQQNIIIILLIVLLALIAIRYACKFLRWLRNKRCFVLALKKLQPKTPQQAHHNSKDLGGTTISNVMAINDMERATSQIYSVTGAADGSVMTMTTPVSTRYPAENSTTPTTIATEYSYDNQALAVTPVTEKPNGGTTF